MHDSQVPDQILDDDNTASDVRADSAHRSAEIEEKLKDKGLRSRIHRKGKRNKPLSDREKKGNKRPAPGCASGSRAFGSAPSARHRTTSCRDARPQNFRSIQSRAVRRRKQFPRCRQDSRLVMRQLCGGLARLVPCTGIGGDEVVHALTDIMYADAPYTVIQRAMHIHPTVSELIPTLLADLKPLVREPAS